jgi:hypothetical protein
MKTGKKPFGRLVAVPSTTSAAVRLGAIVGGAISLFQNGYRVSRGHIEPHKAAANVIKDTAGSGLATAAGALVVSGMGMSGLLGFVGFMTGSGFYKGWWDAVVGIAESRSAALPPSREEKAAAGS